MTTLFVVAVLALQVVDAAGPGEEIGPPVTEESQPHEGEDLDEEPAPPRGRDWGEDAGAPDAARGAAAPRAHVVGPPARTAKPGEAVDAAPTRDAADRTGTLIAVVFLAIVAIALATMMGVLRSRRRR